jgi:hypothetical protein
LLLERLWISTTIKIPRDLFEHAKADLLLLAIIIFSSSQSGKVKTKSETTRKNGFRRPSSAVCHGSHFSSSSGHFQDEGLALRRSRFMLCPSTEITIFDLDYANQIILPFPSDLHCVDGRQRG